jgi:hypothetical protein
MVFQRVVGLVDRGVLKVRVYPPRQSGGKRMGWKVYPLLTFCKLMVEKEVER